MYDENELLPLSGLQHLLYCERRAALVHIEQVWDENKFTADGREFHSRAHESGSDSRKMVRISRGLRICSYYLGLIGQTDVVEFHRSTSSGIELRGSKGKWVPFPIEYKRGKYRMEQAYAVQLCAQALCLEEMLDAVIPFGAIFFGSARRRLDIEFTSDLRRVTEEGSTRLHKLLASGVVPPALYEEKKCKSCSLFEACQPRMNRRSGAVADYLNRMVLK